MIGSGGDYGGLVSACPSLSCSLLHISQPILLPHPPPAPVGPGLVQGLSACPTQPALLSPMTPQLQQALAQLEEQDACFEFRQQQLTVHRVHITFLPHKPPPPQPHDVTLVAQLSMER